MGGASSVVALLDKGLGLGVEEQADLVPLQRQIIEKELSRQNSKAKNRQSGGGGGRPTNPRAGGGNNTRTTTTKYINESEKES
jgi:hypothetical protein